jgi:putative transposase
MASVDELTPALGIRAACVAMGVPRDAPRRTRGRVHRESFVGPPVPRGARPRPPLALADHENQLILDTLNSDRFVDVAPV